MIIFGFVCRWSTNEMKIQLITSGAAKLHINKPWRLTQETLRAKIETAISDVIGDDQRVDLAYTCTQANDPAKTKHLCGHWGEHYEIMAEQLNSKAFLDILGKIKTDIDPDKVDEDGTFNIVLLCNQGRHRSVAQAKMLSYILRSEGFNVLETIHHSDVNGWDKLCRTCTKCGPRAAVKRSQVRQDVLDVWVSL